MAAVSREQMKRRLEAEAAHLRRQIDELAAEPALYDGSPTDSLYGSHPADQGTDIYEEEKALALKAHMAGILNEVEEALRRVEAGTYGRCEECGREIAPERLEILPYVRLCVLCQSRSEMEGRKAA